MFVPEPVMSVAVEPKDRNQMAEFGMAFDRFQKEDPTFHVDVNEETKEVLFSGMGELHLDVYVERISREYGVPCKIGRPRVNYRETITQKTSFDYQHKQQSGGRGQYARIMGSIEPILDGDKEFE